MPPGFSGVTQIPNFDWDYNFVEATTAGATGLTGPASGCYEVVTIHLSEFSNNARTVNIQLVPSGGSPGTDYAVYFEQAVAAKATVTLHNYGAPLFILNTGETLQFDSSANDSINVMVIYKIHK